MTLLENVRLGTVSKGVHRKTNENKVFNLEMKNLWTLNLRL
jgi:hypothetical protein